MLVKSFNPAFGLGQVLATSTTSGSVAIGASTASVCITNQGDDIMYVAIGDSTVVATTADYCLMPLAQVSVTKAKDATHIAAIAAANTPNLHVIPGEGI